MDSCDLNFPLSWDNLQSYKQPNDYIFLKHSYMKHEYKIHLDR